jgi:hypothetical protein
METTLPERKCDVVMKGGVTSGIVYPPAVRELAEAFRFVNIGGTSAGAIAASLTAAAEYRRHAGGGLAGFDRLAQVPHDLARDHALLGLFKPNETTAPIFNRLITLLTAASTRARVLQVIAIPFVGLRRAVTWTIVGAGLAAALLELGLDPVTYAGALATFALGVVVGAFAGGYVTLRDAVAAVVANGFGLASGVDETNPSNPRVLGVWLADLLDEVAGLAPGEHLTFGHLWYGRTPTAQDGAKRPDVPLVNLEMVSTCISHGRPYTFPTGLNIFYFNPALLKTYVRADIVDKMLERGRPPGPRSLPAEKIAPFARMPVDRDLPVVLATRMSLAFPILLSAVQLGAAAYTEDDEIEEARNPAREKPKPEPCWFADGGLSSNFPVHLFDGSLPRWPTFGINLGRFLDDESDYDPHDESQNVWMPKSNDAGRAEVWSRFKTLPAYLGAMFNGIKDWNDNVQMKVPGFRDRIVTVKLRASEGGLNLDMGPELIAPLVERGRAAGQLLVRRFAVPSVGNFTKAMDWENHRVVRYRVAMSAAQRFASAFTTGYEGAQPGDATYDELLEIATKNPMHAYRWKDPTTATRAPRVTRFVADLAGWLARKNVDFTGNAPKPEPELAKRARY